MKSINPCTSPGGDAPPWRGPRASAWPRRPQSGIVRLTTAEEFSTWILHEDENLLVVNKPGDVVCHPSKAGPWSSLVGAAREHTGLETMHLIFRLDRETSGVVILAKNSGTASWLQKAMMNQRVAKKYLAVLVGELAGTVVVDQPLGDDLASQVFIKFAVRPDGKPSITKFTPLARAGGFTLSEVVTETGRKHQIRAHAQWLGYPLVGDKIYGPDALLYLEFINTGWTPALQEKLLLPRQALHCAEIDLALAGKDQRFAAPVSADFAEFCRRKNLRI